MHLDHLSFAAGHEGLRGTAERLGELLGTPFSDGGFHPRFGTRNMILPLTRGQYLEVVEVLDHPAAEKAPFGQAVRERSAAGGGWLGWVVAVDDIAPIEQRLGRTAVDGSRHRPDGQLLHWQQVGVVGMKNDPHLPFFVHWLSEAASHPSAGGRDVELVGLEMAGDRTQLDDWLGGLTDQIVEDVAIKWTTPSGQSGLEAAVFATPRGEVRI